MKKRKNNKKLKKKRIRNTRKKRGNNNHNNKGKKKTIIKQHWIKPDVVSKKKKNDELQLVVDWKIGNPTDVVIKRISEKSFSYEDVGCFRREFPNVERLLWEYELPISLKEDIISLPISQSVEETFFDWEKYEKSIQTKHNKKVMERIGGLI